MRKNTQEVFDAWKESRTCKKSTSIWTESGTGEIWSYATLIVKRYHDMVILNKTKYSVTTTNQQNGLHSLLSLYCTRMNLVLVVDDDIPRGYGSVAGFKEVRDTILGAWEDA